MNELKERLFRADRILHQVSVCGNDAFLLVEARKELKAAFDLLKEEGDSNGG